MLNVNSQHQPGDRVLKCFVVDDEKAAINKLESFIKITPGLAYVGSETDPLKAQAILSIPGTSPDILFLDIEMKGPFGLKLAKQFMHKTLIVFTTGHSHFAADAYRVNAVDYLLKPITYSLFLEAVVKCKSWLEASGDRTGIPSDILFLKDALSGQIVKVNHDDITFIQSIGNYCHVHLKKKPKIMPHLALKQILSQLPVNYFARVHKSYVINIKHIQYYDGNATLELVNDIKLEVGRTFRKRLKEKMRQAHGK
jgi:DNA-binding LytR/AlgR family response regulator